MKKLSIVVTILSMLISSGLTSCNIDSSTTTSYDGNHCAITYMTLGTLLRESHITTSRGTDSTYMTTFSGSMYPLYVDQYKGEIYNPDSLPLGTRVDKVVFSTISHDGILAYRLDNGTDTVFAISDTVDFTHPRVFTCYSYSGLGKRTYTVNVNVHKVNPEAFVWSKVTSSNETMRGITSQRAFCKEGMIYVFAIANNAPVLLTTSTDSGTDWTLVNLSVNNFNPESLQLFKGNFYTLEEGVLKTSSNGSVWTSVSTSFTADALIASGSSMMFAMKDGNIYKSGDAISWELDDIESDAEKLPVSGFTSTWSQMTFNGDFEYVICGGTNANGNVEWRKVIDNKGDNTEPWSLYMFDTDKAYPYPSYPGTQVLSYDSKLFALGIEGDTLSLFNISYDSGRTWKPQRLAYQHPLSMAADNFSWVMDENKYMWIICGGSGDVWRGRINRLGFKTNQTIFTE